MGQPRGSSGWILLVLVMAWCWCLPLEAAEPVKIAAIFAKTGEAVVVREGVRPEFAAMEIAVGELNQAGGLLGHPIEVLEYDNKSSALGAKLAAEEAVKAGVIAVIGATRSSHSLGMAPVLEAAGIPMISPISTNPQLTRVGEYIFRVCFVDDFQGEVMATFAVRDLQAKTAVVLTNASEKFSLSLSALFIEKFTKLGGTILWEGDYLGDSVDFSAQVNKLQQLAPDVCFVPGYDSDVGYLLKQSRERGIKTVFLSGDGLTHDLYKYAGAAATGTYVVDHWHMQSDTPVSVRFKSLYAKIAAPAIDSAAPLTYDAVMLLADAVGRAKSLAPREIRRSLAETRDFPGATGTISFDAERNPANKSAVILQFGDSGTHYVKTIAPQ